MFVIPQTDGRVPGVHWPISLAYLASSRPVRDPVSRDGGRGGGGRKKRKGEVEREEECVVWISEERALQAGGQRV